MLPSELQTHKDAYSSADVGTRTVRLAHYELTFLHPQVVSDAQGAAHTNTETPFALSAFDY